MLTSGDVVSLDLGHPAGREAGFHRPAVVVTAQRILDAAPSVVQVVPLTTRVRDFGAEVLIEVNGISGLAEPSSAQCQHVRSVSSDRVDTVVGNVGPTHLHQIRQTMAMLLDIPF